MHWVYCVNISNLPCLKLRNRTLRYRTRNTHLENSYSDKAKYNLETSDYYYLQQIPPVVLFDSYVTYEIYFYSFFGKMALSY